MEQELIIVPKPDDVLAFFVAGDKIDPLLQTLRDQIDKFTPDATSRKGRDEIKSFAAKIGKAKTALENAGAQLAAEQKAIPKKIDASRKKIWDTLEGWQKEVRQPLTDWEAAEEARIKKHSDTIEDINRTAAPPQTADAQTLRHALDVVTAVEIGPCCEEFEDEYRRAKDRAVETLNLALTARKKFESDQAELAELRRLKAESEAREAASLAARQAQEAVERQEQETAARVAAEVERAAQAEREAAARAIEAAARAPEAERLAGEQRERDLKEAAEAAERRAIETEARIRREAEEAKAIEDAATAKREKDKAHMGAINRTAVKAFVAGGISEEIAKVVVTLIAKKIVPAISIQY